jgi:hypothetical protein
MTLVFGFQRRNIVLRIIVEASRKHAVPGMHLTFKRRVPVGAVESHIGSKRATSLALLFYGIGLHRARTAPGSVGFAGPYDGQDRIDRTPAESMDEEGSK